MIRKSVKRFSEEIMLEQEALRSRAPAPPPNIGMRLTASTTAKVITSIAIPSTAIAARSPLSLRS